MAKDEKDYTRLNINVHVTTMACLRSLAARRGTTVTETVRRAIAVLDFVEKTGDDGEMLAVVTRDADGNVITAREVVLVG